MKSYTLVTAALILDNDEKNILLVLNKKDPTNTQHGFPGGIGGFEKYDDPAQAVKEEVRGDTGCIFEGEFYTYRFRMDDIPTITLFFVGKITGQPRPVCKNIKDVKYFPLENATKMKLMYEGNNVLEQYIDRQ
ncbi:NUDIX hydrolase [Patescibacteria group bacterium]|nr:NUDIX hydrolase [Patescibacteria group bacterium]